MTDKTKEQLAAEKQAEKETKAAAKAAEKQAKAEQKESERKAKAEAKVQEKEAKAKARIDIVAGKKAEKEAAAIERKKAQVDKAAAKTAEKEARAAAKIANQMPMQNGARRPRPLTLCGQAWALADKLSADLGQPVPIKQLLEASKVEGLNEGNVRTEYARWRKFNGVTGRISLPKPEAKASTEV